MLKKVTDPNSDLGAEFEKEKGKERAIDCERDISGINDPMSPEKIALHELTAVKTDTDFDDIRKDTRFIELIDII